LTGTGPFDIAELDLRGHVCPSTLLLSLRRINVLKEELRAGTVRLEILTENRDSTGTLSDAASSMGYGVKVEKEKNHYRVIVGRID